MRLKLLLTGLLIVAFKIATLFAQSPEKMSYQAVIRNKNNQLIKNTQIGMQISILRSASNGIVVYQEKQAPNTNANGLVSIEIGTGVVINGDFSIIDWSDGTYFIKTETDPTGGMNYSITGISQLLSVPYALHAKTAETLKGNIIESDPIFTAWDKNYNDLSNLPGKATVSLDGLMSKEDKAKLDSLSLGNNSNSSLIAGNNGDLLYYNGSEWVSISAPSENNMVLTFCYGVPTWTQNGTCPENTEEPVQIGDYKFGGIVFYIFQEGDTGYVEGEEHGLVCAIKDQSIGSEWGCSGTDINGADGTAIGTGAQNTIDILSGCSENGAAKICSELELNGFSDWFLPSKDELLKMYENRTIINTIAGNNLGTAFANTYYWTSSEIDTTNAWFHSFAWGNTSDGFKYISDLHVRAVRAF